MSSNRNKSAERLADHFVNYLFDKYRGSLHVRRVASWVGLIVLAIDRIADARWIPRHRRLSFTIQNRTFKARYNHHTGARGGIQIVEVLPGRGSPEGKVVHSIRNLNEARDFYTNAGQVVRQFITTH